MKRKSVQRIERALEMKKDFERELKRFETEREKLWRKLRENSRRFSNFVFSNNFQSAKKISKPEK